jgi:heme/copper-type cytochrome/quinol oxidase subunit 3
MILFLIAVIAIFVTFLIYLFMYSAINPDWDERFGSLSFLHGARSFLLSVCSTVTCPAALLGTVSGDLDLSLSF